MRGTRWPRRVRHLGEHSVETAGRGVAVIEAHGVEAMPERAHLREQPDRPVGSGAETRLDGVAHADGKRSVRIAEIVAPAKAQQPGVRAYKTATQQVRQLVEVEVGQRDAMLELAPANRVAPVADRPLVDAARAHYRGSNDRAILKALCTPSS